MTDYKPGPTHEIDARIWVDIFYKSSRALIVISKELTVEKINKNAQALLREARPGKSLFTATQDQSLKNKLSDLIQTAYLSSPHPQLDIPLDNKILRIECQPLVNQHYLLLTLQDITRQKQQQQQIEQQQRLVCLGATAAGILHDLANPLTAMASEIEIMQLSQQVQPDKLRNCHNLIERMQRILREFSGQKMRPSVNKNASISLPDIMRKATQLLRFSPHFNATQLQQKLNAELPCIKIAESHLLLVLLNLLDNASKACQSSPDSKVIIAITGHHATGVFISISDNGPGMNHSPPDYRRGFGAGLTISQHIVASYHGQLELLSTDNGTTAHLFFPQQCCLNPLDSHSRAQP